MTGDDVFCWYVPTLENRFQCDFNFKIISTIIFLTLYLITYNLTGRRVMHD